MQPPTTTTTQALAVLFLGLTVVFVTLVHALSSDNGMTVYHAPALLFAVLLSVVGYWLLSISRRIHPSVRRSFKLSLNPADLKERADNGLPFSLELGSDTFEVSVAPAPAFDESFELIELTKDGERRQTITEVITYAGTVVGREKSSNVRLAITESSLSGYVRLDDDWWFIEPLRKFRLDANVSDYVAYRTRDLRFRLDFGNDAIPSQPTEVGAVQPPHRVNPSIGINFGIDAEYLEQASWTNLSAYQHNLVVLNAVNGVFRDELGCEFVLKNLVVSPSTLTSTNASELLDQLEETVKNTGIGDLRLVSRRQATNSEVVHLTTAKNLDGSTIGIAFRPGVYSLSQHKLIWVGGGGGFGGPPNLAYMNMMIMAHELGHNFNGRHDEADEWCVTSFIICLDKVRTIMWPTLYDDSKDEFSDGSRNPARNNVARISENMTQGRNQNF